MQSMAPPASEGYPILAWIYTGLELIVTSNYILPQLALHARLAAMASAKDAMLFCSSLAMHIFLR